MEYAENRPTLPTRRSLVAPLVALLVGAGAAVGGYALIDDQNAVEVPGDVRVISVPGPGQGVRGIDDMAHTPTAQAQPQTVVPYLSHGYGVQPQTTKDEAATAAAIGTGQSGQSAETTKDEAATAAAIGAGESGQSAESANRSDPHGPAALLHRR